MSLQDGVQLVGYANQYNRILLLSKENKFGVVSASTVMIDSGAGMLIPIDNSDLEVMFHEYPPNTFSWQLYKSLGACSLWNLSLVISRRLIESFPVKLGEVVLHFPELRFHLSLENMKWLLDRTPELDHEPELKSSIETINWTSIVNYHRNRELLLEVINLYECFISACKSRSKPGAKRTHALLGQDLLKEPQFISFQHGQVWVLLQANDPLVSNVVDVIETLEPQAYDAAVDDDRFTTFVDEDHGGIIPQEFNSIRSRHHIESIGSTSQTDS
ncbi:hypothetical protein RCL1_003213 [Eukaryota sp. TZLM3-RCL]